MEATHLLKVRYTKLIRPKTNCSSQVPITTFTPSAITSMIRGACPIIDISGFYPKKNPNICTPKRKECKHE
jgi:hypothetical protein